MRNNNFPEQMQHLIQEHEGCDHINIPAVPGPCRACKREKEAGKNARANAKAIANRRYR